MSAYAKAGAFLVVGTCSMKLRRFAILSSVFVCFGTSGPAIAATLVVDNDFLDCPQADFNSIQAAVVAAQPGDKILVCPGVYVESVLIDKNDLRIEARAAPGEVVLQGTPAQQVGFHLLNTTGVLLQGFTVRGFLFSNIRITRGSGNTLRKNVTTLTADGPGIHVSESSANVVEQNISFANPGFDGIFVGAPVGGIGTLTSDNIIRHNEAFENGMSGITLARAGRGNIVFGNRSHHNTRDGVNNAGQSHETVIENNHVFANSRGGIQIGNSTEVTARNNRSESNSGFGIRLQNGAANNLVEKNEVLQNTQDGIQLEGGPLVVTNNSVQLNLIRQNGRDGVRVFPTATGNTIERNVIRESGEHDAHDDSVGTGTAGTANLWIENKCETENRPELCKSPGH